MLLANIEVCKNCSHMTQGNGLTMLICYCGVKHGSIIGYQAKEPNAEGFRYHWSFSLPSGCPYQLEHLLKPDAKRIES